MNPNPDHDRFVENFFEPLAFALKPNNRSDTGGDILSTVHRGGKQIFIPDKIKERLRVYCEKNEECTHDIIHQSLIDITREIGNRFGVGGGDFLGTVANAKLGLTVNYSKNQTNITRYNHFEHRVVKRDWRLPSLSELRKDYVQDDFFRTLESVDKAIEFQDSNGYYFIEQIKFGGSVSYSSHTSYSSEEKAKEAEPKVEADFLGAVAVAKQDASASIRWKVETKQQNGMKFSARKVSGGNADANTLQEWKKSLDDPKNLHIVEVTLRPIFHLISDTNKAKRTTKEMLKRALKIKTRQYLKYCFESSNSIIFHSNVDAMDKRVSIECRQVMVENSCVFVSPSGENFKTKKQYQVVFRRRENGQTICLLEKCRDPKKSDKFLCARNRDIRDGGDQNDRQAEWILEDLPVLEESNNYWESIVRAVSGLKETSSVVKSPILKMLSSAGAFLPEHDTIQRWKSSIRWESILQATSHLQASEIYRTTKSRWLALEESIDQSLRTAFPQNSAKVKLFLFLTMTLSLIGTVRFFNRPLEQTPTEKVVCAVTQFGKGIVAKLPGLLADSYLGNAIW